MNGCPECRLLAEIRAFSLTAGPTARFVVDRFLTGRACVACEDLAAAKPKAKPSGE